VRWRTDGELHEQRTDAPGALVAALARDGEPRDLEVVRPGLEDIYLDLIRRHSDVETRSTDEIGAVK
jgi:ABC-2 type transport system ATP-binding protein